MPTAAPFIVAGIPLVSPLVKRDTGELLWGKVYQLPFSLNPLTAVYTIGTDDADHADMTKNVMFKMTGKEPEKRN